MIDSVGSSETGNNDAVSRRRILPALPFIGYALASQIFGAGCRSNGNQAGSPRQIAFEALYEAERALILRESEWKYVQALEDLGTARNDPLLRSTATAILRKEQTKLHERIAPILGRTVTTKKLEDLQQSGPASMELAFDLKGLYVIYRIFGNRELSTEYGTTAAIVKDRVEGVGPGQNEDADLEPPHFPLNNGGNYPEESLPSDLGNGPSGGPNFNPGAPYAPGSGVIDIK